MKKFLFILVAIFSVNLTAKAQNNNCPNGYQNANQVQYIAPTAGIALAPHPNSISERASSSYVVRGGGYYPTAGYPQQQNQGGGWIQVGVYNGNVSISGGISIPANNNRNRRR